MDDAALDNRLCLVDRGAFCDDLRDLVGTAQSCKRVLEQLGGRRVRWELGTGVWLQEYLEQDQLLRGNAQTTQGS